MSEKLVFNADVTRADVKVVTGGLQKGRTTHICTRSRPGRRDRLIVRERGNFVVDAGQ